VQLKLGRVAARRPSPALVVALVALFVALGGTGVAAVHAVLPPASVGTAQLRNGAVNSLKVRDGSLGVADLAPAARAALEGDPGPAGAPGLSDVQIVSADSANDSDNFKSAVAECPSGKTLIAGGAGLSGPAASLALTSSAPSDPGEWIAIAVETSSTPDSWLVRAYAVCAKTG
jgi:hypothetical protein